jgi:hypothetical protein
LRALAGEVGRRKQEDAAVLRRGLIDHRPIIA